METEKVDRRRGQRVPLQAGRYEYCWFDGAARAVHQVVWEEWNGPIPPGYCVHHIDGNRLLNILENLQLMLIKDHFRLHQQDRWAGYKVRW